MNGKSINEFINSLECQYLKVTVRQSALVTRSSIYSTVFSTTHCSRAGISGTTSPASAIRAHTVKSKQRCERASGLVHSRSAGGKLQVPHLRLMEAVGKDQLPVQIALLATSTLQVSFVLFHELRRTELISTLCYASSSQMSGCPTGT